jgi:CRP-like cAMP-binding protein
MNNQSLWFLENIDVSGVFCPKKMKRGELDRQPHRTFKKGTYIYFPDDYADRIYFITEGRVKIGAFGEGDKEITKAILGAGEVFGELSLVGENKRRDFAYAMEDVSLCILSIQEIKELMREHTWLGLFLMKVLGSRVLEMEQRLESLVFKDSRTRVVEFLLGLARKKGQQVGYETVVRKFITHQEIANITATSRQTVTTVLNELRERNILTFDRKRLLIRDMNLLEREMGG